MARSTWYWLMVMPVTLPWLVDAMVRMGPPTPQPTSRACLPGPRRMRAAMRPSWADSHAGQSLPGRRGEKVEGGPPSPLVQVGHERVELVDEVGDLLLADRSRRPCRAPGC